MLKTALYCFALFLLMSIVTVNAQDMSNELKTFLENKSFPELLNQYKQETIRLTVPGRRTRSIAARPFVVSPGYRCQVFAGTAAASADRIAQQIRQSFRDSVYVIDEEGLYKVQVGNFDQRADAENLMNRLFTAGYRGVWIVESNVHLPKSEAEQQRFADQEKEKQRQFYSEQTYFYAIQVLATIDAAKAQQTRRTLENETRQAALVLQQGSIWKVVVGRFDNRSDAEQLLRSLKRRNYTDAWVTQVAAQ